MQQQCMDGYVVYTIHHHHTEIAIAVGKCFHLSQSVMNYAEKVRHNK